MVVLTTAGSPDHFAFRVLEPVDVMDAAGWCADPRSARTRVLYVFSAIDARDVSAEHGREASCSAREVSVWRTIQASPSMPVPTTIGGYAAGAWVTPNQPGYEFRESGIEARRYRS